MQPKLAVEIGRLKLKNPVMVASGTFGYAQEFSSFMDLKRLGAIVTKTITLKARPGNPSPRTCETPAGMLNSIGLENPGLKAFVKDKLPSLVRLGVPVIVSIASEENPDEFVQLASALDKVRAVGALELNISCPNIHSLHRRSRGLIAQDPQATFALVQAVRKATRKTLITKLSPNVSDIVEIARAAEKAGSDALALINTVSGMAIDVNSRRPKIAMVTAGLSGPAIRPIAVRMVWEVAKKIKIPVIGMGGIIDAPSALEFLLAGATALSLGTVNFIKPAVAVEIIDGLKKYMTGQGIPDIATLSRSLKI